MDPRFGDAAEARMRRELRAHLYRQILKTTVSKHDLL